MMQDNAPNSDMFSGYQDLLSKVKNGQNLLPEERKQFYHDYLQRYSSRLMNDEEIHSYKNRKLMISGLGLSFAVMVPASVTFLMLTKHNITHYAPQARNACWFTSGLGCVYYWFVNEQNKHLDAISSKHFAHLSDQQLIDYHEY